MSDATDFDSHSLLEDAPRLKALAVRLAGDSAAADDALQETWLTALRTPRERVERPAPWLRTVLRHQVRRSRRTSARREARERRVARPEAQASTSEEVVERAELLRHVVDGVLDLPPELRDLVLMRFFEELPLNEIARRHDLPPSTVRSRLQNALDRLRRRLDGAHGDREAWRALVAPWVTAAGAAASAGAASAGIGGTTKTIGGLGGGLAMKKAIVSVGLVIVALIIAWNVIDPGSDAERSSGTTTALGDQELANADPAEGGETVGPERLPRRSSGPVPGDSVPSPSMPAPDHADVTAPASAEPGAIGDVPPLHVHGTVFDPQGRPVPNVALIVDGRPERTVAVSAEDGTFEATISPQIDAPPPGVELDTLSQIFTESRLLVSRPPHVTVRSDLIERASTDDGARLIVTSSLEVGGTVLDPQGAPVPEARVKVRLPVNRFTEFPDPLDGTRAVEPIAECDADGRFLLGAVPTFAAGTLEASAPGYDVVERPIPSVDTPDLRFVLEKRVVDGPHVQGVVVHENGAPAVGAVVQVGNDSTKTDGRGHFLLRFGYVLEDTPIVAALPGYQPAVRERYGTTLLTGVPEREVLELRLGPPALAITGRVVDHDGDPLARWRVTLDDPTVVTVGMIPLGSAETLASGQARLESFTNDRGEFRLDGLRDRDYVLKAYDLRRLWLVRSDPISAGTRDVVIEVPEDLTLDRVRGRVVSRRGTALAGVKVFPRLITTRTQFGSQFHDADGVVTNANGDFVLHDVPRNSTEIGVGGDRVIPDSFPLPEDAGERDLVLEAAARCHFQVHSRGTGEPAARIRVLDVNEKPLSIFTFEAHGSGASTQHELIEGRSRVLAVSEDARTLVALDSEGNELERIAIALVPGETIDLEVWIDG